MKIRLRGVRGERNGQKGPQDTLVCDNTIIHVPVLSHYSRALQSLRRGGDGSQENQGGENCGESMIVHLYRHHY